MKYLNQFLIIMGFSFLGEALQRFVPLPIPASVYGILLLFLALLFGIVKIEQVREAGIFLRSILPLLFVPPMVSLLDNWALISSSAFLLILLTLGSTFLTFGISGKVTQWLMGGQDHA